MQSYMKTVQALSEFSPSAKVFVLVHKMDKVYEKERTKVHNC